MQAAREPGIWTRRRVATLVLGYLAGLGGMILVKGVFLSADRYFLILLVPALALRVGRALRARLPAASIALVLLYEEARGVAHSLHPHPFYEPMLTFDRWIGFGEVPTIRLQDWLWQGHLQWYDHALSLLDRLHFIVPPTLLLLIWLERREVYYRCAATLVGRVVRRRGDVPGLPGRAALAGLEARADPPRRAHRLHRGRQLAGRDVEVVDRVAAARQPGRRRAVAARRLRAARAALRLRLARPASASGRVPTRSACGSRSSTSATTTSSTSWSARPTRWPAGSLVPRLFRARAAAPPARARSRRRSRPAAAPERGDVLRSGP